MELKDTKLIVGIDVGIVCLAMTWVILPDNYKVEKVDGFVLIDLTKITHEYHRYLKTCGDSCKHCLKHKESKNLYDRLTHFFAMYDHILSRAHQIFVEYQPLQGHKAVEQIIYGKYREKIDFVHPATLQSYFLELKHLTYEQRKSVACGLVKHIVDNSPDKEYYYELLEAAKKPSEGYIKIRAHDIADAILILKYGVEKRLKDVYIREKQKAIFVTTSPLPSAGNFFDKFLHKEPPPTICSDIRSASSFKKGASPPLTPIMRL